MSPTNSGDLQEHKKWAGFVKSRIRRFMAKWAGMQHLADDIAQEAWIGFAKAFQSYDAEKGSLAAHVRTNVDWAMKDYVVQYSQCIKRSKHVQQRMRAPTVISAEEIGSSHGGEDRNETYDFITQIPDERIDLDRDVAQKEVQEKIWELGVDGRVFLERFLSDGEVKLETIGERLGVSREAIRQWQHAGEREFLALARGVREEG